MKQMYENSEKNSNSLNVLTPKKKKRTPGILGPVEVVSFSLLLVASMLLWITV